MNTLTNLRSAGFAFRQSNGHLKVRPAIRLTDDQRRLIKMHKDEIIQELKRERRQRELLAAARTAIEIIRQLSNHEEFNHD